MGSYILQRSSSAQFQLYKCMDVTAISGYGGRLGSLLYRVWLRHLALIFLRARNGMEFREDVANKCTPKLLERPSLTVISTYLCSHMIVIQLV